MRHFLSSPFSLLFSRARVSRAGLSLIELLIFAGIFSAVMIGFITIMVAVIRVQSRQSAAVEVNQESQFLLRQFQFYVERSSLVDMPEDASSDTLTLRMRNPSEDPTVIRLSGGIVYIKKGGAPEEPLTTTRVTVSDLEFTKRANPPGKDSVNLLFTMAYNTPNITRGFIQSLQTSVARVSAATFDSDVSPSSTDAFAIGTGAMRWNSINSAVYFSNSNPPNVGVGTAFPNAKLHVNGSIRVSGGDVYVDTASPARGIILRAPDNSCWRLVVNSAGVATTSGAAVACP